MHGDDQRPGGVLLGLHLRPPRGVGEELAQLPVPERVAQHAKGAGGIAVLTRRQGRRHPVGEIGAQGLVLALPRLLGLQEEPVGLR